MIWRNTYELLAANHGHATRVYTVDSQNNLAGNAISHQISMSISCTENGKLFYTCYTLRKAKAKGKLSRPCCLCEAVLQHPPFQCCVVKAALCSQLYRSYLRLTSQTQACVWFVPLPLSGTVSDMLMRCRCVVISLAQVDAVIRWLDMEGICFPLHVSHFDSTKPRTVTGARPQPLRVSFRRRTAARPPLLLFFLMFFRSHSSSCLLVLALVLLAKSLRFKFVPVTL